MNAANLEMTALFWFHMGYESDDETTAMGVMRGNPAGASGLVEMGGREVNSRRVIILLVYPL
ncbi:MAG: hypothetical protein VCD66_18520 [Alphaproteobacteria bacterium]|jgi:hypothetical protein